MNKDKAKPAEGSANQVPDAAAKPGRPDATDISKKKPEDLTPDELRLLADTMPGEGPGDD